MHGVYSEGVDVWMVKRVVRMRTGSHHVQRDKVMVSRIGDS